MLYAPAAPESFDKALFRGFIQKLRELELVKLDENSKLVFDERLNAWARDAKVILGREMRHTIERSPEAAKPEAGSRTRTDRGTQGGLTRHCASPSRYRLAIPPSRQPSRRRNLPPRQRLRMRRAGRRDYAGSSGISADSRLAIMS